MRTYNFSKLSWIMRNTVSLSILVVLLIAPGLVSAATPPSYSWYCSKVMYGRQGCHGYAGNVNYFSGTYPVIDSDSMMTTYDLNGLYPGSTSAIPFAVDTAPEFIAEIEGYLARTNNGTVYNYNAFGAASIVDTMLGENGPNLCAGGTCTWKDVERYAVTHLTEFETRVNYYASQPGWINWNQIVTYPVQTYDTTHPCTTTSTSGSPCLDAEKAGTTSPSDKRDFVFRAEGSSYTLASIVFNNPDGSKFSIVRLCGNLIGNVKPLAAPTFNPPTCDQVVLNPGTVDPKAIFTITASVDYDNATDAAAGVGAGDKIKISVSGPSFNYNSGSLTTKQVTPTDNTVTATTGNVGPTNNSGLYIVTYNIYNSAGTKLITPDCSSNVAVADMPYFGVSGGDVSAGASMGVGGTDCATTPDPHAGIVSWNQENAAYDGAGTQQAAFALNFLQDFATAQGTASRVPTGLSFSNTNDVDTSGSGTDTYGGALGSEECAPDYFSSHPTAALYTGGHTFNTTTDLGAAGAPKKFYMTGNLTIPGTINVPNGSHTVIYVDGDVQINGNILYSNSYSSVADIPSFTIVARGNIFVAGLTVSELDGWFIAQPSDAGAINGNFYSCASGFTATALSSSLYGNCNNQLKVYGSIVARQVWLGRTSGTLYANTRSEQVYFTPESWLSSPFGSSGSSGADYDSITSLPPAL